MEILTKAIRFSLPLMAVIFGLVTIHFSTLIRIGFAEVSGSQIALNYILLSVLFESGILISYVERQKSIAAFKRANKKTSWQRLLLSVIFLLFTSSDSGSPIAFSLHFLVPYLVLTIVSALLVRKLA